MKIKMYMATSLNGYIAREDDNVEWMQEAQWESYDKEVAESGHIVLGNRTYGMLEDDEVNADCTYYVLSNTGEGKVRPNVVFVQLDSNAILEALKKNNAKNVLVIGGSKTNSFLLNSGLIDEVMIDIEPLIISSGINLVDSLNADVKLELLSNKTIGNGLLQLRYKVIR